MFDGDAIGPYRLIRKLGEGGMGVVFHAQQTEPIRRDVALKVIRPGMDSDQVIARFESERQALALMEHSNIAYVLDAGTTEAGLPYFVMELVDGVPITGYCDRETPVPASADRALPPGLLAPSSTRTRRASSTATSSRRTSS